MGPDNSRDVKRLVLAEQLAGERGAEEGAAGPTTRPVDNDDGVADAPGGITRRRAKSRVVETQLGERLPVWKVKSFAMKSDSVVGSCCASHIKMMMMSKEERSDHGESVSLR